MTVAARPIPYAAPPTAAPRRRTWPYWLLPIGGIGLFFMLLVPTMCRSSEVANRIKSSSNLRQIGVALAVYANAHDHALPPDFAVLVTNADLTSDCFVSPIGTLTDRATGPTPADWGGKLVREPEKYCSYAYAGDGLLLDALPADAVLAYERTDLDEHDGGLHLLYADGTVDWVVARTKTGDVPAYARLLADAKAGVRPLRWPL